MRAVDRFFGRTEPTILPVCDLIPVDGNARWEDPVSGRETTGAVDGWHDRRIRPVWELTQSRYSSAKRWRQRNGCEMRRRKEVVLTGFVDHAQLSVGRGLGVGERFVNLPRLERDFISVVAKAEHH